MAEVACSGIKIDLLSRLNDARTQTDSLFEIVRKDSLYERPIPERHRIIFYIGHLEAFDRNLFNDRLLNAKSSNAGFDHLFAFGIDPVGGQLPHDQPRDWPSLDEVGAYRRTVRDSIDSGLERAAFSDETSQLLNVAIEHRLMHAETLSYMFHRLPLEQKIARGATTEAQAGRKVIGETVNVPRGTAVLGLVRGAGFGWDNEFEALHVDVPPFAIDKYKVTNAEFLDFVLAGGYDNRALWPEEDWRWIKSNNVAHPRLWIPAGNGWLYRTMFDEISLPLDWPVYTSHAEAAAYARWAGKALPTEAEWQRAAHGAPPIGNFDFLTWNPVPVTAFPESESAWGARGMCGNGWEWTSSTFEPFPGFEPFAFYPGYSANFFDGKHYVLKGGSARTAACMVRPSFRNWFQPHYQYVYAGFRCVTRIA